MDGDAPGARVLQRLAPGLVGDLVGKDDDGVRIADLVREITFIAADALEGGSALAGRGDVFGLESVHTADKRNAHGSSPEAAPFGAGLMSFLGGE